MNTLATQLTHPQVRQLYWCLSSPELAQLPQTQALHVNLDSMLKNWLIQLDQNPAPLQTFLSQHNHTLLGSYFECLWQFFFQDSPGWRLLGHNIQVIENKITLGELDILAQYKNEPPLHLELAVKFYLQHPKHNGQLCEHWLGPQSRDRLDLKLGTLQNKQLPFIHQPCVKRTLQARELPQPDQQALIFKGYLFHQWQKDYQLPAAVNPHHLLGQWLHQSQVTKLLGHHDAWLFINKPQWLGNITLTPQNQPPLNRDQVSKQVKQHFTLSTRKHALMLVKLVNKEEGFVESARYLIVNDSWPQM